MEGGINLNSKEMSTNLERIYQNLINCNRAIDLINSIDFLGINVSETGEKPYEFKIYYEPEDHTRKSVTDHEIIGFAIDRDMVRCRCEVQGASLTRDYIALKNRSVINMKDLYQILQTYSPYINSDMIRYHNLFSITDSVIYKKAPLLHMIGVKTSSRFRSIFNLEWLLRDELDDECIRYKYNDMYYFRYIKKICISEFDSLVEFILLHWKEKIKKEILHLWLMAIDYFPDGRKKYKLYLKDNFCSETLNLQCGFSDFFSKNTSRVESVFKSLHFHTELKPYGFALCLSSMGERSINFYLVSADE